MSKIFLALEKAIDAVTAATGEDRLRVEVKLLASWGVTKALSQYQMLEDEEEPPIAFRPKDDKDNPLPPVYFIDIWRIMVVRNLEAAAFSLVFNHVRERDRADAKKWEKNAYAAAEKAGKTVWS